MNFKSGVCNLCGTGCGHFLQTEGKRISSVSPSIKHPVSKGKLCVRGWHIHELLNSDARIQTPLLRCNGKLTPVSYEEAFSFIKSELSKIDHPEQAIGLIASARASNEDQFVLSRISRSALGTRNIGIGSEFGHSNSINALHSTFGVAGAVGSLSQLETSKYILVLGSDITKMNPIIGSNIHLAAKKGARLVTLSSFRSQIAKLSKKHFQQKPATKRIALNAFAKAVLELRGPSIPEAETSGFEDYALALRKLNSAEIESACGLSYRDIQEEMKLLLESDNVSIIFSSGISGLDDETTQALVNFAKLTGKLNRDGSGVFPATGICNLQGSFDMGLGSDRINVFDLLSKDDSSLKALFVVDHDDGIIRHSEKIKAMDLVVYFGAFENKFMDLAHVVLPIAAFTEYDGTYTSTDRRVQLSCAKTEPPQNVWPAWKLYTEFATQLGRPWHYKSSDDVFRHITEVVPSYTGLSHTGLAKGFGQFWKAPVVATTQFLKITTHIEPPSVSEDFPYSLMIGKASHFWHQNNLMRKTFIPRREYDATLLLYPQGYIELNSADAMKLGVKDKWLTKVVSKYGAMKVAVKISDDVQVGAAYVPYFIGEMVSEFLLKHHEHENRGEESLIPIRFEKV